MSGLSNPAPPACNMPSSVEATIKPRIATGSQARRAKSVPVSSASTAAGTSSDASALRVEPGDSDSGRHGGASPPIAAASTKRARPGSACHHAGGKGTSCNNGNATANINRATAGPSRMRAGKNKAAAQSVAAAATRTTTCPATSSRDAPPAAHRTIRSRSSNKAGKSSEKRFGRRNDMGMLKGPLRHLRTVRNHRHTRSFVAS